MQSLPAQAHNAVTPAASSLDSGRALIGALCEAMDHLVALVEQETALVRAGKLREASALEAEKSEIAGRYRADGVALKAMLPELARQAPDLLDLLRRRHDSFRALLQINLTVLATVHAVSESVVRGVAGEIARKSAPRTYGANGQACAPARAQSAPISVSRTL